MALDRKLTFVFLAMLLMVALLSVSSLVSTGRMKRSLDGALNSSLTKATLVGEVRNSFEELRTEATSTQIAYVINLLEGESAEQKKSAVEGVPCTSCHQLDSVGDHKSRFNAIAAKNRAQLDRLRLLTTTQNERAAIDDFAGHVTTLSGLYQQYLDHADRKEFGVAHQILVHRMYPAVAETGKAAAQLAEEQRLQSDAAAKEAQQTSDFSRLSIMVCSAFSVLVSVALLWLVRRVCRVLKNAVSELGKGAEQVAGAASQILGSSQSLAQGAVEQASSIEETSAASREINSRARESFENSELAARLVVQSREKLSNTSRALDRLVEAMNEIEGSSGKVSRIIKVIDEIAFQTNILALNAAVEAARAGDSGLGFAVVADEVRNLAQRCSNAAKDTAALIEDSISKSQDGKSRVEEVTSAIRSATDDSGKVATMVAEVNRGSQDQARGIEEISTALSQMDQVTQAFAANTEESAATAEALNSQAIAVNAVVFRLQNLLGGKVAA